MNPDTLAGAKMLLEKTKKSAARARNVGVIVAPSLVHLAPLAYKHRGKSVAFAAQGIHHESSGSYTGNVSAVQVKDAGATYAIIGHAERRAEGWSNADIHRKVIAALDAQLTVILCVGEKERDIEGLYIHTVREQIASALSGVPEKQMKRIIIAYEPVWAIGKTEAPKANDIHQMVLLVRKCIADTYDIKLAESVRVLYGGSVEADDAESVLAVPGLNGALIGHASLDPIVVDALIKIATRITKK